MSLSGDDLLSKPASKIGGIGPEDVLKVIGVEMHPKLFRLPAGPEDFAAQREGKAGFEIYASLLAGEIGDHKFSLADLGQDAEIDVLVRMNVLQAHQNYSRHP